MLTRAKPRFMRHFVSGFALGALCVVATQAAHADTTPPTAIEASR